MVCMMDKLPSFSLADLRRFLLHGILHSPNKKNR